MEFDHAQKTPSYLDAGDAGFSYMDTEYIRYSPPSPPSFGGMDLPASPGYDLHALGLNNTLNEVYYQPSSPSSSGTASGAFGSPPETFAPLEGGASITPPSLLGPSYTLTSAESSMGRPSRGSGSLSPPIHHSPSAAIPRALANVGRRYNPIARPQRRKPAARRATADDDSEDDDDDFQPTTESHSAGGGPDTRRETIRRQRIESEQRRRDELRDGYARLKETLPATNQKSSKVSLLDRATNHVRNLEIAKSDLEKRLQDAESQVKRLRSMNEALSMQHLARPRGMVASY